MLCDSRQKWGDRGRGDRDTHGDREMHTGKRQSDKPSHRPSLCIYCILAYVSIPEGGQISEDRSHVNTWEEETTETVNESPEVKGII